MQEGDEKKERRSSILKPQKPRHPFGDLDFGNEDAHDDDTATLSRTSRRVSFARSNFVKQFAADPEKNTIWDTTYEESVNRSSDQSSSHENCKIAIKSTISKKVEIETHVLKSCDRVSSNIISSTHETVDIVKHVKTKVFVQPASEKLLTNSYVGSEDMDITRFSVDSVSCAADCNTDCTVLQSVNMDFTEIDDFNKDDTPEKNVERRDLNQTAFLDLSTNCNMDLTEFAVANIADKNSAVEINSSMEFTEVLPAFNTDVKVEQHIETTMESSMEFTEVLPVFNDHVRVWKDNMHRECEEFDANKENVPIKNKAGLAAVLTSNRQNMTLCSSSSEMKLTEALPIYEDVKSHREVDMDLTLQNLAVNEKENCTNSEGDVKTKHGKDSEQDIKVECSMNSKQNVKAICDTNSEQDTKTKHSHSRFRPTLVEKKQCKINIQSSKRDFDTNDDSYNNSPNLVNRDRENVNQDQGVPSNKHNSCKFTESNSSQLPESMTHEDLVDKGSDIPSTKSRSSSFHTPHSSFHMTDVFTSGDDTSHLINYSLGCSKKPESDFSKIIADEYNPSFLSSKFLPLKVNSESFHVSLGTEPSIQGKDHKNVTSEKSNSQKPLETESRLDALDVRSIRIEETQGDKQNDLDCLISARIQQCDNAIKGLNEMLANDAHKASNTKQLSEETNKSQGTCAELKNVHVCKESVLRKKNYSNHGNKQKSVSESEQLNDDPENANTEQKSIAEQKHVVKYDRTYRVNNPVIIPCVLPERNSIKETDSTSNINNPEAAELKDTNVFIEESLLTDHLTSDFDRILTNNALHNSDPLWKSITENKDTLNISQEDITLSSSINYSTNSALSLPYASSSTAERHCTYNWTTKINKMLNDFRQKTGCDKITIPNIAKTFNDDRVYEEKTRSIYKNLECKRMLRDTAVTELERLKNELHGRCKISEIEDSSDSDDSNDMCIGVQECVKDALELDDSEQKITEGCQTFKEKIEELHSRCDNLWNILSVEGDVYRFETVFELVVLTVALNPGTGEVLNIEIEDLISDKCEPIILYLHKIFMAWLTPKCLCSALGDKYNILSLLDYLQVNMQKFLDMEKEFNKLVQTYAIILDRDFRISFTVVSEQLMSIWKFSFRIFDLDVVSNKTVIYFAKMGTIRDSEIKKCIIGCPNGFPFIKAFVNNIYGLIHTLEEKKKQRGHHADLIRNAVDEAKPLNEVLVTEFNITVTREDLLTLVDSNWLNDVVVNFYMNLISERGKLEMWPKAYTFNTFFYPKISREGQVSVRRWTKSVDIFAYDIVAVPVHSLAHWSMAIIDFRKKEITYCDSLGKTNNECLKYLLKYLRDEHMDKKGVEFNVSAWKLVNTENIPQQMNEGDCGVFACLYAEISTRDNEISIDQDEIPKLRRRMIQEILECKLHIT